MVYCFVYLCCSIHQQYPSYSSTVRLAKRWISAQMLDQFILSEALELVVAHLFLHPAPYSVTATPQTGFLRFLKLLSTHDWKTDPLIVNLNGELNSEYRACRSLRRKPIRTFCSIHHYHPHAKNWEGTVFTGVCLSRGGTPLPDLMTFLGVEGTPASGHMSLLGGSSPTRTGSTPRHSSGYPPPIQYTPRTGYEQYFSNIFTQEDFLFGNRYFQ